MKGSGEGIGNKPFKPCPPISPSDAAWMAALWDCGKLFISGDRTSSASPWPSPAVVMGATRATPSPIFDRLYAIFPTSRTYTHLTPSPYGGTAIEVKQWKTAGWLIVLGLLEAIYPYVMDKYVIVASWEPFAAEAAKRQIFADWPNPITKT